MLNSEFDIILLDLGLPDSIGLETLKKIQVFNVKISGCRNDRSR